MARASKGDETFEAIVLLPPLRRVRTFRMRYLRKTDEVLTTTILRAGTSVASIWMGRKEAAIGGVRGSWWAAFAGLDELHGKMQTHPAGLKSPLDECAGPTLDRLPRVYNDAVQLRAIQVSRGVYRSVMTHLIIS